MAVLESHLPSTGELEAAVGALAGGLAAGRGNAEDLARLRQAAGNPSALSGDDLTALADTALRCAGGMKAALARPPEDQLLAALSAVMEAAFAVAGKDARLALNSGLLLLHRGQKEAAKSRLARASRIARTRKDLADVLRQAQLALLRDLSG